MLKEIVRLGEMFEMLIFLSMMNVLESFRKLMNWCSCGYVLFIVKMRECLSRL